MAKAKPKVKAKGFPKWIWLVLGAGLVGAILYARSKNASGSDQGLKARFPLATGGIRFYFGGGGGGGGGGGNEIFPTPIAHDSPPPMCGPGQRPLFVNGHWICSPIRASSGPPGATSGRKGSPGPPPMCPPGLEPKYQGGRWYCVARKATNTSPLPTGAMQYEGPARDGALYA